MSKYKLYLLSEEELLRELKQEYKALESIFCGKRDVWEHTGLNVSSLYSAQVKRKRDIIEIVIK